MNVQIEYEEYECGLPCIPNGCPGHETDVPCGLIIEGFFFDVSNELYPPIKDETVERLKAVVNEACKLLRGSDE